MPFSIRRFLPVTLLLFATSGLTQQTASKPEPAPKPITLNVVVTPKSGAPVTGLTQDDFTVFDNQTREPITSFREVSGPQAPAEIVLLIDSVNINYTRLTYERQQIERFLQMNGGHLAHPTSLAILTDTGVRIQQGFFTDGNELSQALAQSDIGLRQINRDAGFYGAEDRLTISLQGLQALIQKERSLPGRKLIVWVSPGWAYLSGPEVQLTDKQEKGIFSEILSISQQLREGNFTLYSVDPRGSGQNVGWEFYYQEFLKPVKKPSQAQLGDLGLQIIAIHSGGLALNASNDIAGRLEQCVTDTLDWYEITYTPPTSDQADEYHQIEVKVGKPGLTAHTRSGYYGTP